MGYTKIKTDLLAVAINQVVNFSSAKHGFLSELNEGAIEYPMLLLTPPDKRFNLNGADFDSYSIVLYALELNQIDGDVTDADQRTDIWDALEKRVNDFLTQLQEIHAEYLVSSEVKVEPNAHQFNDDTILLKVSFQLRVDLEDC